MYVFRKLMLKMDIESQECVALRASKEFFSILSIEIIFVEILLTFRFSATCVDQMVETLQSAGFKIALLQLNGQPVWKQIHLEKWQSELQKHANDVVLLKNVEELPLFMPEHPTS